jgi:AcrR family transcriptional regulator
MPMSDDEVGTAAQALAQHIEAGLLPEVNPAQQQRSLRNAMAMLMAGHQLLRDHALEELSIETICERAGTTVGAFYGRFGSKDGFFLTLQRLTLIQSHERLEAIGRRQQAGEFNAETMLREVVALMVDIYRRDRGILKSSLQRTGEGTWLPIKASGDRFRKALSTVVAPSVPGSPKQAEMRVRFAYQAVVGVLVNATLNNPGPLDLDNPKLVPELVSLVTAYLWH